MRGMWGFDASANGLGLAVGRIGEGRGNACWVRTEGGDRDGVGREGIGRESRMEDGGWRIPMESQGVLGKLNLKKCCRVLQSDALAEALVDKYGGVGGLGAGVGARMECGEWTGWVCRTCIGYRVSGVGWNLWGRLGHFGTLFGLVIESSGH
jgi:hypothetical protein